MIGSRLFVQLAFAGRRQACRLSSSVVSSSQKQELPQSSTKDDQVPMSKAMKAYMERAQAHESFMAGERHEFQVGRRHLANMMGVDETAMTQEDVDNAIKYLFPSGLFEPKARPFMRDPEMVYPRRKAAEFDRTGRPLHAFFYTCYPNFYELVHTVSQKFEECDRHQDLAFRRKDPVQVLQLIKDQDKINTKGTEWLDKDSLEKKLLEKLTDQQYVQFTTVMDRLLAHPFSHKCKEFVEGLRKSSFVDAAALEIPALEFAEDGKKFCRGEGKRKWAFARVKVFAEGSGKFTVNGHEYLPDFFQHVQEREVIVSPLVLTGLLGQVDVEAEVEGGYRTLVPGNILLPLAKGDEIQLHHGYSARAGAVRFALSRALCGLVDEETRRRLRIAGFLTMDMRYHERTHPGRTGPRKKWTWKKR